MMHGAFQFLVASLQRTIYKPHRSVLCGRSIGSASIFNILPPANRGMWTAADWFQTEEARRKSAGRVGMTGKQLFDDWPERYDRWFEIPVGKAVLKYETELILKLLRPGRGERILDAGRRR